MTQFFTPGQTVYLLYWRRREESELTRVQIFVSKRRRDNANVDLLAWGLITMTATWEIPTPVKVPFELLSRNLKEVKTTPNCPKCGASMECLYHGKGTEQWVCPNACDSTLDEVLKKADRLARQVLGDDELCV